MVSGALKNEMQTLPKTYSYTLFRSNMAYDLLIMLHQYYTDFTQKFDIQQDTHGTNKAHISHNCFQQRHKETEGESSQRGITLPLHVYLTLH